MIFFLFLSSELEAKNKPILIKADAAKCQRPSVWRQDEMFNRVAIFYMPKNSAQNFKKWVIPNIFYCDDGQELGVKYSG